MCATAQAANRARGARPRRRSARARPDSAVVDERTSTATESAADGGRELTRASRLPPRGSRRRRVVVQCAPTRRAPTPRPRTHRLSRCAGSSVGRATVDRGGTATTDAGRDPAGGVLPRLGLARAAQDREDRTAFRPLTGVEHATTTIVGVPVRGVVLTAIDVTASGPAGACRAPNRPSCARPPSIRSTTCRPRRDRRSGSSTTRPWMRGVAVSPGRSASRPAGSTGRRGRTRSRPGRPRHSPRRNPDVRRRSGRHDRMVEPWDAVRRARRLEPPHHGDPHGGGQRVPRRRGRSTRQRSRRTWSAPAAARARAREEFGIARLPTGRDRRRVARWWSSRPGSMPRGRGSAPTPSRDTCRPADRRAASTDGHMSHPREPRARRWALRTRGCPTAMSRRSVRGSTGC